MTDTSKNSLYAIIGVAVATLLFISGSSLAFAATEVVTGDTSAGENQPGWLFNRDTNTDTPFEFNTDAASIGDGSLYVLPISANAADKMIAENFINTPIADVNSISYDFQIGAGGVDTEEEHFYMNVYANFGQSDDLKFYDCRYNVVPTVGSVAGFTTVTFDPTQSYPVTTRAGDDPSPFTCPAIPADMDDLSAGSNIRVFALNVGDTSVNDEGLDGYLDNVVVDLDSGETIYDFEPAPIDEDGDGVIGDADKCEDEATVADSFPQYGDKQAKNRWMWDGTAWVTNAKPGTMGGFAPTIEDTYGCSGEQILDAISDATGLDFGGEYKFGITKGTIEAWIEGRYYMGEGIVDTLLVDSESSTGADSEALDDGAEYLFRASGTANAGDNIEFDADFSFRTPTSIDWTDDVNNYESYGDTLLDLMVDGGFVTWGDNTFHADHIYEMNYVGTGAPVNFTVYDVYYPGNVGTLTVDIIGDIYVDLW